MVNNPEKDRKEKKEKKKLEGILKYSVHIFLLALFTFLVISYGPEELRLNSITGYVSFDSSPLISPGDANTYQDLSCSWTNSSDTINVTVVWFQEGVVFSNITMNASIIDVPQNVSSSNTLGNENWTCRITLDNGTDTIPQEDSIIIENTDPETPEVYYNSVNIGEDFTMVEDSIYNFVVNSTDEDNDPLEYTIGQYSDVKDLCNINSSTGEVECIVIHDNILVDGNETINGSYKVKFWVTDNIITGLTKKGKEITFTLLPVNDAPTVSIDSCVTDVNVDTIYVRNFTVSDEESDPYNLSLDVGKISGLGNINDKLRINESSDQLYFNTTTGTANYIDYGDYNITITVFDASNYSINSSLTFTLTINSTNTPPNITKIEASSAAQGESFHVNLSAYDIDINDTVMFDTEPSLFNDSISVVNDTVGNITYFNATLIINNLTNEHVINRKHVDIIATDSFRANTTEEVNFNITNANDAPIIYDISDNSSNVNYGSNNISNLTAYIGSEFTYYINYSDIDSLTYEGENISFDMNLTDEAFTIDNNGLFSFNSTDSSYIGEYIINITMEDDGSSDYHPGEILSDSKILNINILNNTDPYFNHTLNNITCDEDEECYIDLNATDDDAGDNYHFSDINASVINNFGNQSINLTIDSSTGVINFTPNQSYVGNYSVNITLEDDRGGNTQGNFNLYIENTNDAPYFVYNMSFPNGTVDGIFVDRPFFSNTAINAYDPDLDIESANEQLTYSYNITPENPESEVFILNSSTGSVVINTSAPNCNKTYNLTITVNDTSGSYDTSNTNFTIYKKGSSPNIEEIRPYGNKSYNYIIVYGWEYTNVSQFSNNTARLVMEESDSVIFNHSTDDLDGGDDIADYLWYIDDTLVTDSQLIEDNHTLNYVNGYFSNGSHIIELTVRDKAWNTANWTWNITIDNVNRAPELLNPLPNFTGRRSFNYVEITDYFTLPSQTEGVQRFYDPDFDLNSNNISDENETSNLDYTYTSGCDEYVNIVIINDTIIAIGEKKGNCSIYFNATDPEGLSNTSNEVFFNVTEKYDPETSSSGGSSSSTVVVPIEDESDPEPLEIISPKSVVIYQNSTMDIPIELKNNWTSQLQEVSLSVSTDAEDVEYQFSKDYFNMIPVDESEFVNLTVSNYREPGSYEIKISASVKDPDFNDSAVIIVNSLEKKHEGETLETKLSFARDLLNTNQDCQELNELLTKAQNSLVEGDREKATEYLDLTINGCKYLISEQQEAKEKGGKINFIMDRNFLRDLLKNKTNLIIASIIIIIIVVGLIVFRKLRLKKLKKEEINEYSNNKTDSNNGKL